MLNEVWNMKLTNGRVKFAQQDNDAYNGYTISFASCLTNYTQKIYSLV